MVVIVVVASPVPPSSVRIDKPVAVCTVAEAEALIWAAAAGDRSDEDDDEDGGGVAMSLEPRRAGAGDAPV